MAQNSPEIIVEEIRRQVSLQVSSADSLDTRAMAVAAAVTAVAAFVAPRVVVDTPARVAAACIAFALVLGVLGSLLLCVRPRKGGFSNGPDVSALVQWKDSAPSELQLQLVDSFEKVRASNEDFLASKGDWMICALRLVLLTMVAVAGMVAVGGIR